MKQYKIAENWEKEYHKYIVGDLVCTINGNHDNLKYPTKINDIQGKYYVVDDDEEECEGCSYTSDELISMEEINESR